MCAQFGGNIYRKPVLITYVENALKLISCKRIWFSYDCVLSGMHMVNVDNIAVPKLLELGATLAAKGMDA